MKAALATLALLLPLQCVAAEPTVAPEPPGLWSGPMVSDTTATLQGAQVIDVAGLLRLMPHRPLLIDVGPADRRPDGLPASTVWRPVHRTIPGAHWFPGAGRADLPPAQVEALLQRIGTLTQGQREAPVVVFCKPRCWGSWNAAKRLVQAGYSGVHWFPQGVHGWQEQHETAAVDAESGWNDAPATPP